MSNPQQAPATPAAPAAKKSSGIKIILIVLIILCAGGGGGAFYMWKTGQLGGTPAAAVPEAKAEPTGVVTLEPFLVNLAEGGGQAYLRATLKLLVTDEEEAKHIQETEIIKAKIRSVILETLATQTAAHLVTPEGKTEVRESILKRIEGLKLKIEVRDVLFSDFVVQY
jgi:flagellar protein FliL